MKIDYDNQAGLSEEELDQLFSALTSKRKEVIEQLQNEGREDSFDRLASYSADEADIASNASMQDLTTRLMDKQYKLLREIDRAIGKMEDGSYGLCEGTNDAIEFGRLTYRPWTRYSVAYKEELEYKKARGEI